MKKILYLNNGRSAIDIGIKLLAIKKGSQVLVPEIICDVAVEVILRNNLDVIYYKLDNKFQPIWNDIYKKSFNKVSSIIMVHFFGYPQDISKFKKFAKKKKILLIEDNCHSLNIKYKGHILGLNGDIGIDSPRKILSGIYSGGRLFINKKNNFNSKFIKKYRPNFFEITKKNIKDKFPILIKIFKILKNRPSYESPYVFSGKDKNYSLKLMDEFSKNKLIKFDLKKESLRRVKIFNNINDFAKKNKIKPVFKISKNLIPLYFVGITKDHEHSKKIYDWGWKNNIEIVSWPSFYRNKKLNKTLLNKWSKYICISLSQNFNKNLNLIKINF